MWATELTGRGVFDRSGGCVSAVPRGRGCGLDLPNSAWHDSVLQMLIESYWDKVLAAGSHTRL
jgi:hypothetical protein